MRPDNTVGNDPEYLRRFAKLLKRRGQELHAARMSDIAHKVEQLERVCVKRLVAALKDQPVTRSKK